MPITLCQFKIMFKNIVFHSMILINNLFLYLFIFLYFNSLLIQAMHIID